MSKGAISVALPVLSVTNILGSSMTSTIGSSNGSSFDKQPTKENVIIRTTIEMALTRMNRPLCQSSINLLLIFTSEIWLKQVYKRLAQSLTMAKLEMESILILVVSFVIIIILVRELFRKYMEINRLKLEHEGQIKAARKDSNERQRSTIKGQISETIAPWSMDAVNSVKELNFLGNPIDFIGFKGLDGDDEVEIKFIEVKSGKSKLNKNQRRVRDAVKAKRIEWVEVRINEIQVEEKTLS